MSAKEKHEEPAVDPLTTGLPGEAYQNEQFKSDPDPVSPAVEPEKATAIDIAPNQPYPTGNPATPEDAEEDVPNKGKQPVKKGE